ncbi:sugar ABC transporter permease [Streptomyces phaeoluteigriseus]|uniref:Sugar ABC transporter permease n=1 Tax=Streptomyces phaeoluteigriseus TaxID=114686 RepID=A0ABY4ZCX4_9ACTN|nr:sugar ABC transporter permease [Streptomyces phaeoluteigriseus]USQ86187.1 sugar ABC transporter permease [Streptomyces phaeoluteigriseus]
MAVLSKPPATAPRLNWRRVLALKGASFTAPFFLGFLVFTVVPLAMALRESLYREQSAGLGFGEKTVEFVWFDQFAEGFSDGRFWASMLRVALFAAISIPLIQIASIGVALLLDVASQRVADRFRVPLLIPYMIPGIVATLIWIYVYSPDVGPLTPFLHLFGIDADFYSGELVWVSIGNLMAWSGIGFNMLIVYAALRAVDQDVYSAARIDGASEWRIAWSIKVPLVRRSLVLTTVLSMIGTLQIFSDTMLFKSMAPETITRDFTPIMAIYDWAFQQGDFNYASALSIILALVVGTVSAVFYRLTNKAPTS